MFSDNKIIGKAGEEIACIYLKRHGYTIISRNYTCRFGEIDIIASIRDSIFFIEIKTRRSLSAGNPEESVNFYKVQKIKKAIDYFLYENTELASLNLFISIISIILTRQCAIAILISSEKELINYEIFKEDKDYFVKHFKNIDE